jgi:hypothetical protein
MSTISSISGRVGATLQADGTNLTPFRQGKTGEQVVSQAHGKYFEPSHRGVLFTAGEQGAGTAPGTALGTTAAFCLYNPQGSGKRLAIKKVRVAYFSGTLGAGVLYHSVNNTATQTAPSSGTSITPVCADVGNTATPVGKAGVGQTVVQPTIYGPMCTLGAEASGTALQPAACAEDVDGEIVVEPGCTYQLQGVAAAGTSPKITMSVTWEEVPIV